MTPTNNHPDQIDKEIDEIIEGVYENPELLTANTPEGKEI